jgi:hypothetical protein
MRTKPKFKVGDRIYYKRRHDLLARNGKIVELDSKMSVYYIAWDRDDVGYAIQNFFGYTTETIDNDSILYIDHNEIWQKVLNEI